MPNKKIKPMMITIGRFRSHQPIKVPQDLNQNEVNPFLDQFSLDDQVDLLCVTEFEVLNNYRNNFESDEARSMLEVHDALHKRALESPLKDTLEKLGLTNSFQYRIFGEKLRL